jgi:hypothetical protein
MVLNAQFPLRRQTLLEQTLDLWREFVV